MPPTPTTATATHVNPKWLRRMTIYTVIGVAIGIWGLVDALYFYPRRGVRAAEFYEFQQLDEIARSAGSVSNSSATIENPKEHFARLGQKSSDGGKLTPVESAQYKWMEQLANLSYGSINPAFTRYPREASPKVSGPDVPVASADQRLQELRPVWTRLDKDGKPPPYSPLSKWDLPSQWLFVLVGFGAAAWILMTVFRVRGRTYRFDHATHALTLPTGESLTPADVKEFDKTKWDKVYITLHIREGHPQLAGRALELDLLRYVPLEEWVLTMEKAADAGRPAPSATA